MEAGRGAVRVGPLPRWRISDWFPGLCDRRLLCHETSPPVLICPVEANQRRNLVGRLTMRVQSSESLGDNLACFDCPRFAFSLQFGSSFAYNKLKPFLKFFDAETFTNN